MPDFFSDPNNRLELVPQKIIPNHGLRPGQLGALYALLAHFSQYEDPAVICLPTGYGKTSVMMAAPFLLEARRILVVEPTIALRKQVANCFKDLSILRRIGVIGPNVPNPSTLRHEGRPDSVEDWEVMRSYDVVVTTPSSSSPRIALGMPKDLFDLVIIDEAHHVPADTWSSYLEHLGGLAKFIFLTATPFRRDGRLLPGRAVYRYPVMRAAKEEAFGRIVFKAAPVVDEFNEEHIDRAIASAAVAQLKSDHEEGFDHRLFVRAESIHAARALVPIYRELGVAIEAVDSRIGRRLQDKYEKQLIEGTLQGIVCVDMFGEGYDFPKLKVAALHAPHRSLVPTIQFIGRFARVDPATGPATLIAPRTRMKHATAELIKDGIELSQLIDEASLSEIARVDAQSAVFERLRVRRQFESNYEAVSPLALELYAHLRVFACSSAPNFEAFGELIGRDIRIVKQWTSEDGCISLLLTADECPPSWAISPVLMNLRHDAFLFIYKPESERCYIGSTRRTEKLYLSLMEKVCPGGHLPLSYEQTSRARAGLRGVKFYNVGLKNTTINSQAESYRTLTGPQAERAVTTGDSRAYVQGHFFGSGTIGDERETIGASSGSRIWSNQRLTVSEFFEWVDRIDARLSGTEPFAETHLDIIRSTKTLSRLPDNVIAAGWPKSVFRTNPRVRYLQQGGDTYEYRRLADMEIGAFDSQPDNHKLFFSVNSENFNARLCFTLEGGPLVVVAETGKVIQVESGPDGWTDLDEWLASNRPVFYASDKSSFEGMNLMSPPALRVNQLSNGDAFSIDWRGCEIEVEFLPGNVPHGTKSKRASLRGNRTVQEHLEHHLRSLGDMKALFYDHRTGEAADYIAATQGPDNAVKISLYHCKRAGGSPSGSRVNDVYEVAGQMVKSVSYCDPSILLQHIEYRGDPVHHATPSKFIIGDFESLRTLVTNTPATKLSFEIVGVQPGIDLTQVDEHLADLMTYGISYAKQGGAAGAYWLISDSSRSFAIH